VSESAAERLTAWLWEDERLTAGLEDLQAGVLLQWAADRLLQVSAVQPDRLPRLTAALRSVFVAARHCEALPADLRAWAEAELLQLFPPEQSVVTPDPAALIVAEPATDAEGKGVAAPASAAAPVETNTPTMAKSVEPCHDEAAAPAAETLPPPDDFWC
jgi:hypothetical protein